MPKSIPLHFNRRLVVANALICGIIGLTVGLASAVLFPWLIGSVLIGATVGWLAEKFFRKIGRHARLYRRRLIILVLIEALLIVYVFIPVYGGYQSNYPARQPISITPAQLGLSYEDVRLTTADGLTLAGWYVPTHNGAAIIAVHGFNGNRMQMLSYAQALSQRGYGVLLFDMRAHGESGGDRFAAGWNSDLDVLAAADYLHHRSEVQPDRIGALGLSSGAAAVLYAAAKTSVIKALIADGTGAGRYEDFTDPFLPEVQGLWFMAPMNWMLDRMVELFSGVPAAPPLKEVVARIAPRSVLFVAAGQSLYEISFAHRYAAKVGPSADVWELPEAGHVGGFSVYPEEYTRRMIDFFDVNLPADN